MSTLRELEMAQVAPRLLEVLRKQGLATLTKFQSDAVEGGITRGASQILLTSDFEEAYVVAEIALLNKVASDYRAKAMVICPNPHHAEKRFQSLSLRCRRLGIEASSITRRRVATSAEKMRGKVFVTTYASLRVALRKHPEILEDLACVLIDRLDFLGHLGLGAILETDIVSLMGLEQDIQYISVTPPLADIHELSSWLESDVIIDHKPDVKVIYSVKAFKNVNESLMDLMQFVHQKRGQVMVLCPNREATETFALQIAEEFGAGFVSRSGPLQDLAKSVMSQYPKCEQTKKLGRAITHGIGFMHEGVARSQRRAISEAWEDEVLPVIIMPTGYAIPSGLRATTVFLMGVYIGISSAEGSDDGSLTILSEWQMSEVLGSAGRRGKDNEAFAIVVVDNETERQRVLSKYFYRSQQGDISPREGEVDSSMDDSDNIQDLILSQLCSDYSETKDPFSVLRRTFWTASRMNEEGSGVSTQALSQVAGGTVESLIALRATRSAMERATEIQDESVKVVTVTPEKLEGLIHSASRDLWHHVALKAAEGVSCTCESWKYQGIRRHRLCKHLVKFIDYTTHKEGIAKYARPIVDQALRGLEILNELELDGLVQKDGKAHTCTELGESVALLGIPVGDAKRVLRALSRKSAKIREALLEVAVTRRQFPREVVAKVLEATEPGKKGSIEYCDVDIPGMVENCLEELQYLNTILASLVTKEQTSLLKDSRVLETRLQELLREH